MLYRFSTKKLIIVFTFYFYRLIRNPLGSTHPEATLKACLEHGAPDDAIQAAKAEFHAHLAANRSQQGASSHDLVKLHTLKLTNALTFYTIT